MPQSLPLTDRVYRFAIWPVVFAYRKFAALDGWVDKQKSRLSWRIYRPRVVLTYILYGWGNFLWLSFLGLGFMAASLPVLAGEWVGGLWLFMGIVWAKTMRATSVFWRELGKIAKWTMSAVTPHLLFLAAYNGFSDHGEAASSTVSAFITAYELAAVRVNQALSPIADLPWQVWAALASGILILTWVLSRPRLLAASLALRTALQNAIFVAAVTASIGFSYTQAARDWEPGLQNRLEAHLKSKVEYETSIKFSQSLMEWLDRDHTRVLPLIVVCRNFSAVMDQARKSPERFTSEDIDKAFKTSVKTLVPDDLIEMPPHSAEKLALEGTTPELLKFDAAARAENKALRLKAAQFKATLSAFIGQIANVSLTTAPLLNEVVGEIITAASEQTSKRILDSLPLERGFAVFQGSGNAVETAVGSNIDRIGSRIFLPKEGAAAEYGLGLSLAALRSRVFEHASRSKGLRLQSERVRFRFRVPL